MTGFTDSLTRCDDCRAICLCATGTECVCMAYTVEGDSTVLRCHTCTDKHEEGRAICASLAATSAHYAKYPRIDARD